MGTVLATHTKENQRMFPFLQAETIQRAKIHSQLSAHYASCALLKQNVNKWLYKFRNGSKSMTDP
jgi:hypothetical protein